MPFQSQTDERNTGLRRKQSHHVARNGQSEIPEISGQNRKSVPSDQMPDHSGNNQMDRQLSLFRRCDRLQTTALGSWHEHERRIPRRSRPKHPFPPCRRYYEPGISGNSLCLVGISLLGKRHSNGSVVRWFP